MYTFISFKICANFNDNVRHLSELYASVLFTDIFFPRCSTQSYRRWPTFEGSE